jgi:uncharacterized protein YcaQ
MASNAELGHDPRAIALAAVPGETISAPEARRVALAAQGMLGAPTRPRSVAALLRRVMAVQLDTISVLARSHELVCSARLGAVGRDAIDAGLWGVDRDGRPASFEYWAHAACVVPIETWPWFAFRRRRLRSANRWSLHAPDTTIDEVRARLADDGPLTATELGGAKQGGPWWDWSPTKVAVELLLDWGEVVCVARRGWKRVYDLAQRALPADLVADEPDDEMCLARLVALAGSALGVATAADLAEYFRLKRHDVTAGLDGSGLTPVVVEGWDQPAWADPAALAAVGSRAPRRATLLSPFDSLIWDRARTERLFGFTHRLEAYTPQARRVHGYYAMPILSGDRLIGRVDPGRDGDTLVAKQVGLNNAAAVRPTAAALIEAASWVGAHNVAVLRVEPEELRAPLERALGR